MRTEPMTVELTEADIRLLALVFTEYFTLHREEAKSSRLEASIDRDAVKLAWKLKPIFDTTRPVDETQGLNEYTYQLTQNNGNERQ